MELQHSQTWKNLQTAFSGELHACAKYKIYALRARELDEIFPWETVDCGVRRKYLESEYKKSLHAETTRDCRQGCTGCGMNALAGGKCPCER